MLLGPSFGSSSNVTPCSHAFTSSARIPDAHPMHPLVNPATATRISLSLGTSSLTGIGSRLMRRGSLGGIPSHIKLNPLGHLSCHSLGAWTGGGLRCCPIPSFQMTEGFLNVPPRELGFDHITDSGCSGLAVPAKCSPYLPLHPTPPSLAQFTSPAKLERWLMRRHISTEIQSFPHRILGSASRHVSF